MEENEQNKELYNNWNKLKQKLEFRGSSFYFKNGQIWWLKLGQNVGGESYGKGRTFSRPVLIFKKLSSDLFIGIPMTSKIKNGSWYVKVRHRGVEMVAQLHQIRVFDRKRLSDRMGQLDDVDYRKIKTGLKDLLK